MAPSVAVNNIADRRLIDAKVATNFSLELASSKELANLANLILGKSRHRVLLTFLRATFLDAVPHIRGLVSDKKMVGAEACWGVTFMADQHSDGQRAKGEFVGQSVSEPNIRKVAARYGYSPVAILVTGSRPQHASICFGKDVKHFTEQLITGNLVLHICALLWRSCMAFAAFTRCGAFPILPQQTQSKGKF